MCKQIIWTSYQRANSVSVLLGWDLGVCIFNKLIEDTDAVSVIPGPYCVDEVLEKKTRKIEAARSLEVFWFLPTAAQIVGYLAAHASTFGFLPSPVTR